MSWNVLISESANIDLHWFDRKSRRFIYRETIDRLAANPLEESKSMLTLRSNPIAQRELRLSGKYRVLFNLSGDGESVEVVVIGEKHGNELYVRGEVYRRHHESHNDPGATGES